MSRKEEIRQAADAIDIRLISNPWTLFQKGAEWADAHPKKVELTMDEIEQAAKEIIDKDWEKQQEIIWEYIRRQLKYGIINEACDWLRTYAECFHNDTTEEFCLDEMIESFKEAMWKNA